MQPGAAILWRKIRIFLPCRVGHRILCLSMFGLSTRCVRQIRRQWADFLVPLVAPLHRQYKTAWTETRCHLLLKIRQMAAQTSASRGYVLFIGANKGAHTKVLKLSADYEHTLWHVRNLEKHRSSRMFDAAWLEIPDFTIRIAVPDCIWNAIVSFSYRKTYPI